MTVRYPGATRYYGTADHAGKAATKAESEKVKRYGEEVLPLAYETGGRLGVQSMDTLRKLAALAAATDGGVSSQRQGSRTGGAGASRRRSSSPLPTPSYLPWGESRPHIWERGARGQEADRQGVAARLCTQSVQRHLGRRPRCPSTSKQS